MPVGVDLAAWAACGSTGCSARGAPAACRRHRCSASRWESASWQAPPKSQFISGESVRLSYKFLSFYLWPQVSHPLTPSFSSTRGSPIPLLANGRETLRTRCAVVTAWQRVFSRSSLHSLRANTLLFSSLVDLSSISTAEEQNVKGVIK